MSAPGQSGQAPPTLALSALLGAPVRDHGGTAVGRVVDLVAAAADLPTEPSLSMVAVGRRNRVRHAVAWDHVASCSAEGVVLHERAVLQAPGPGWDGGGIRLRRDVLDTQIVDLADKRVARVAEVVLAGAEADWRVVAVDVGSAAVWRRLGVAVVARRLRAELVSWTDLKLTSSHGRRLQLAAAAADTVRLDATDLASIAARLPLPRAAHLFNDAGPDAAVDALAAAHPRFGAHVLRSFAGDDATSLVDQMAPDDAAALLRVLPAEGVDQLLEGLESQRAATLRRLLRHRAGTAGSLMTTAVRTVPIGTDSAAVRALLADDPPTSAAAANVFVIDGDGRPVGLYEPTDLLAGRDTPRPVGTVATGTGVQQVIDRFALHDVAALAVVDDDGVLAGAVAVDDVLEELLAERLPGHTRFAAVRRRNPLRHRHPSPGAPR